MKHDESGQVSAFVVVMTMALFLLGGLVIDGGNALAAKRRVINEAEQAARAGTQALDTSAYRASGVTKLDRNEATRAARSYIAATGNTGTVTADGDEVTVSISHSEPTIFLSLIGIHKTSVTGKGNAHGVRGVEAAQ